MQLDWAHLVPTIIGAYFLGVGVFAVLRQRIPITMTRGFRTSIEWRTGRVAVFLGVWCLVIGLGFMLYAWRP